MAAILCLSQQYSCIVDPSCTEHVTPAFAAGDLCPTKGLGRIAYLCSAEGCHRQGSVVFEQLEVKRNFGLIEASLMHHLELSNLNMKT